MAAHNQKKMIQKNLRRTRLRAIHLQIYYQIYENGLALSFEIRTKVQPFRIYGSSEHKKQNAENKVQRSEKENGFQLRPQLLYVPA